MYKPSVEMVHRGEDAVALFVVDNSMVARPGLPLSAQGVPAALASIASFSPVVNLNNNSQLHPAVGRVSW